MKVLEIVIAEAEANMLWKAKGKAWRDLQSTCYRRKKVIAHTCFVRSSCLLYTSIILKTNFSTQPTATASRKALLYKNISKKHKQILWMTMAIWSTRTSTGSERALAEIDSFVAFATSAPLGFVLADVGRVNVGGL